MKQVFMEFQSFFLWLLGGVAFGAWWVVRNILTNGKRLDMLEMQHQHNSKQREELADALKETRSGVNEIKNHLISGGN